MSRQTISNWETEKTYPDIISVVKMSDLYNVSLDHLLKGESAVSNYLDYLEESTNVVKGKNKHSKIVLLSTYLGIWAISLVVFWIFAQDDDAMAYAILVFYVLLPVATVITAFFIGKNDYYGKRKWLYSVLFGIMYMLAEYATFNAANMIAFDKINMPDFFMIPIGTAISLIGMSIGFCINKFNERSRKK